MASPILDRELKKGSAELLILSLVEDRPRHGYDIGQLIELRSRGTLRFNVASLYPLLYRLEKRGWIRGRWVEKAGQRRRRYYRLTPAGEKILAAQREGWREFASRTWVWVIVLAASIGNMMSSIFVVLGAVISKRSLGGPLAWTVIIAALGAGSLIGGFISLRIHVRRPLYFASSVVGLLAIPTALLALRAPAVVVAAEGADLVARPTGESP